MDRIREGVAFSPSGCWLWKGAKNTKGYGQLGIYNGVKSVSTSVHRLVAELVYGVIPYGCLVCHTCDVRGCCNPEHLYIGTALDNAQDAKARGRGVNPLAMRNASKTHCPQGHPYNEENTRIRKSDGGRLCRICQSVVNRRCKKKRSQRVAQERAA